MTNIETTETLSKITAYMKYARYDAYKQRRETWREIITRNMVMHIHKFPDHEKEIKEQYEFVFKKQVLPSMRSLQLAGKAIERHNNRIYNCCFIPIETVEAFAEIFFLLLCGSGVGFSIQYCHMEKMPLINKGNTSEPYVIDDSIEGWADAVKAIINANYYGCPQPEFDYSHIRKKGSILKTTGGYAPGHEPLQHTLDAVKSIFEKKQNGDKLEPIECHDIICHISEAVYAGGIRRAALISLFSHNDQAMMNAKSGDKWFIDNKQRGMSNNSVVLLRSELEEGKFRELFETVRNNKTGEPGIYITNDYNLGTNPCCEVSLRPYQFCNLTEINCASLESQDDLNKRAIAASIIGTLQATYTDFSYLRPIWKQTTEEEALLGVSLTGIATKVCDSLDFSVAAELVNVTNQIWAKKLGINSAARLTCIKPAGTTSLIFGCSSGIHPYHSQYYIRRLRVGKNEPIYEYLKNTVPELLEDCVMRPDIMAVISIPIKSPDDAIFRNENVLDFLERIKKYYTEWVLSGHNVGINTHNISATISVKDEEWNQVIDWMWHNTDFYNGLTIMQYNDFVYKQTPFEECSKEVFESLYVHCPKINLNKITEEAYDADEKIKLESACSGGMCELTHL